MTVTYLVYCDLCGGFSGPRRVVAEADLDAELKAHQITAGHAARCGIWSMGFSTTNAGGPLTRIA